jgi:hypothetical protein
MFLLLLLMLQQASNPRVACPNLSGDYVIQGEDGRVYINIVQTGCKRMTMVWNNVSYANDPSLSKHVLALDGQFHGDSGWFGFRERVLISARLRSGRLEIVAKSINPADTTGFLWKHVIEPLPGGDLCSRFFQPHQRSWSTMLAALRKTSGSVGETEAAGRSEKGCT